MTEQNLSSAQQNFSPPPPQDPAPSLPPAPHIQSFQPPQETKTLQYHRLSHADGRTRWWSPLVEGVLGGAIYLALSAVVGALFFFSLLSESSTEADFTLEGMQNNALIDPAFFAMMFGSIAIMFPALWIARLALGPKPWGLVHSVLGCMRWSWLFLCTGISIIMFVLLPVVFALLSGDALRLEANISTSSMIWLMVLIFGLVPLQCYAEELVFRGYLMQTLGSWLKHPAWAIILPAPLFMLGHAYGAWGQLSILVMGVVAGFMAWYTGGLEAPIAMHVVNNVSLMFMGVMGLADPFAQNDLTFVDFFWATGVELLLVGLVIFAARKVGVARQNTFRVVISPKKWVKMSVEDRAKAAF